MDERLDEVLKELDNAQKKLMSASGDIALAEAKLEELTLNEEQENVEDR